MSDAPERLVTSKCAKMIVSAGMKMFDTDVEYVRADLYEAERAENARLREALGNSRVVETMLIADHLRDKAKRAEEMPAGFTIERIPPSDVAVILRSAADAIDLRARATLETKKAPGD